MYHSHCHVPCCHIVTENDRLSAFLASVAKGLKNKELQTREWYH